MSIFFGEFLGTLIMILLGNGAVANVLLNQSKGQNGGWIVISAGSGICSRSGCVYRRMDERSTSEPRGHIQVLSSQEKRKPLYFRHIYRVKC